MSDGVLTRGQLRRRSYRRLVQGVYADPGLPFDHRLTCRAVALLLPAGAAIGGHSAAAWYGAPFAGTTDPVTVVCPDELRWGGPRGVRVHRSALGPAEIEAFDDVPVTSVRRTAWDVAALEPLPVAVAALDAMVRSGSIRMAELQDMADRGSGRWRVTRIRRAVPLVDPRAESAPESRVRVALVLAGLAPQPQYEVQVDGQFIARVDFAWPEVRLVLEYEGAHHFQGDQLIRDDVRIARLVAAGWRVLRISAADLRELDRVVEMVREALATH
jgi:very-short-patch-repair endonuclease